ncbi:MAG: aldo/keto reductase [Bacteroidota bacterium]
MNTPFSAETHPNIRRLGLGMAALGRPGYINLGHAEDLGRRYGKEEMQQHAHVVLDIAWEKGVRYFDTARSYGLGELFLGNWLKEKGLDKSQVLISSKWGYTYTANWQIEAEKHEVKEHSLTVLDRQWKESQETLGKYLDLYQIHSATLESGVLENIAVLNRLAELKSQGVAIGLSSSGTKQTETLKRALEIEIDGKRLFDSFQSTYNILEQSVAPVLESASSEGLSIIVKEALANGRLTVRNTAEEFADSFQVLEKVAQELETNIDSLSLAFVLQHSWADQVLSGAAQKEHLFSNLKAAEVHIPDEYMTQLNQLKESPEEYWQKRKDLSWN